MERSIFVCVLLAGWHNPVWTTQDGVSRARDPKTCEPLVIAHRGASGYVPEHTLGAYALAVTMGADYIEPDVVMTKDGHLIARHENDLSLTTDVVHRPEFASRFRTQSVDGSQTSGWFSEDFTLAEIKTLRAVESLPEVRPGNTRMNGSFEIPTMQEIIDLAKSLEISERRIIGVYPEIKHGTHFQRLGLAMEKPLVDLLNANGYRGPDAPVFIQSFEISNLRELKNMTDLPLLQLIAGNVTRQPFDQALLGTGVTYGDMVTAEGLMDISTYATAVGPDKSHIIPQTVNNTLGTPTNFVRDAHAVGLKVHPYTFRAENSYLSAEFRSNDTSPAALGDSSGEMRMFLATGIDGLFTDQPDIMVRLVGGTCYRSSNSRHLLCKLLLFYAIIVLNFLYFFR
ncbi:uncharacterized protein LOC126381801 [Pectinophora gossypiella]|uniref:uncharacterized protein LOC126381801 n=1 Tax=Pectinophora gossypiella TaxID=13191 RepID=UPI00214E7242|nr:uncharacterized protein LOC126381801 [Pectinophora gossypiella]